MFTGTRSSAGKSGAPLDYGGFVQLAVNVGGCSFDFSFAPAGNLAGHEKGYSGRFGGIDFGGRTFLSAPDHTFVIVGEECPTRAGSGLV